MKVDRRYLAPVFARLHKAETYQGALLSAALWLFCSICYAQANWTALGHSVGFRDRGLPLV
jgi:hypothetical protein